MPISLKKEFTINDTPERRDYSIDFDDPDTVEHIKSETGEDSFGSGHGRPGVRSKSTASFKPKSSPDSSDEKVIAGIDCKIGRAPPEAVQTMIQKKFPGISAENFLNAKDPYLLYLVMNARSKDPTKWKVISGEFVFYMDNDVSILTYFPERDGVPVELEKSGSRSYELSLTPELGYSVTKKTSSADGKNTDEIDASFGPKISGGAKYDKSANFTMKFSNTISNVVGVSEDGRDGNSLLWQIYRNEAIETPNNRVGEMIVVNANTLIGIPKNSQKFVKVSFSGKAKGGIISRTVDISKEDLGEFEIKEII